MIHSSTLVEWNRMPLAVRLGNIGAEVARMGNFYKIGKRAAAEKALERALELIDLTIQADNPKPVLRELLRLREAVAQVLFSSKEFLVSEESLNQYFLPFALLARK